MGFPAFPYLSRAYCDLAGIAAPYTVRDCAELVAPRGCRQLGRSLGPLATTRMVFLMPHLADRPLHLVLGGISHETNTRLLMPTAMPDVRRRTLLTGEVLLSSARGSDSALGGATDAAGRNHVLPALVASATLAGPVTPATFAALTYEHVMRPIVPLDEFSNPSSPPAGTVPSSPLVSRMATRPPFTEVTPRAW